MKLNNIKNKWKETYGINTWSYFEACMSAVCTLFLKNNKNPLGLIIIGASSGSKTSILNMFKHLPNDLTHYTDKFTPASFLTQATNVKKEDLKKIDLIEKLPNRILLVPDLVPMFSKKENELRESLSMLTRVLDGQGLSNDGGVQGHREFNKECIFVMLGAIVNLTKSNIKMISNMGTRLLFIRMEQIKTTDFITDELIAQIDNMDTFIKNDKALQDMIYKYFEYLLKKHDGLRTIMWKNNHNKNITKNLALIAELVSKLRAYYDNEKGMLCQYEKPYRVLHQLDNLIKGRAIMHDRNNTHTSDLKLAIDVGLSSVLECRGEIVKALINNNPNHLTLKEIVKLTSYRDTKVREELNNLTELSIVYKTQKRTSDLWSLHEAFSNLTNL